MKWFRSALLLLLVAVGVAAIGLWLGGDHGNLRIEHNDLSIELSLPTAALALLLSGLLLWLLWWLLGWPFRLWFQGSRRRARQRFFDGLMALASGRPLRAEQQLLKASRLPSLRLPALIGAQAAAHLRGDRAREAVLLRQLAESPVTARLATELSARSALADGHADAAVALLGPLDQSGQLSPGGAKLYCSALMQRGRSREALAFLPRLAQSQQLPARQWSAFEAELLAHAVAETTDAVNLHSLWANLNRDQKRLADVALAYARRAVQLNLIGQAAVELEATLKHGWSASVVVAYGLLPPDSKAPPRLGRAEAWLSDHAQDSALLLTLGRLARQERHWIKNENFLQRALAYTSDDALKSVIWEELGRSYAEQGDAERAARALSNALAVQHGERPQPLIGKHQNDDLLAPLPVAEVRDDMGIPRLPNAP